MASKRSVQLLGSGEKWIGSGVRSFHSVIQEDIRSAGVEIVLTAFAINAWDVLSCLEEALASGVPVTIYVYAGKDNVNATALRDLRKMAASYSLLNLKEIDDQFLHAKVIVIDSQITIIGSANATFSGMTDNYELGVRIKDEDLSRQLLSIIRRLD